MKLTDDERELLWLRRLRDLSVGLASEVDATRLFPRILDAALELTDGERGFVVRVTHHDAEGRAKYCIEQARGFKVGTIDNPRGHVSRTVVKRVLNRDGRGLVTSSEEDLDVVFASSVQRRNVLSILCVPLRLRSECLGVLYIDRAEAGAFSERDLPILESLAAQAALVVDRVERPAPVPVPKRQVLELSEDTRGPLRFGALVGGSKPMQALTQRISRVARSDAAVLILGESGTEKELVARELHARSEHAEARFACVNCELSEQLEARLFGRTDGPPGLLVEAGGGTVFLDEVADLQLGLQAKLLRVLQEGRVRPLGALRFTPVSCRIVLATQRDLAALVRDGRFREDLFLRLDVLQLHVPPLRTRGDDVLVLAEAMAQALKPAARLRPDPQATLALHGYSWPGNLRQLEHEIKRLLAAGLERFGVDALSPEIQAAAGSARPSLGGRDASEAEKALIVDALQDSAGNKSRAARALGIPRSTFYDLLDRYRLR